MREKNIRAVAKSTSALCVIGVATVTSGCAAPSFSMRDFPAFSSRSGSAANTTSSVNGPPARLQPQQAPNYSNRAPAPKQEWGRSGTNYGYNYDVPETDARLPKYAGPDGDRSNYNWNGTPPAVYPNTTKPRSQPFARAPRSPNGDDTRSVRVTQGDTLYGLSERHGVSMADVMRLNNMQRPDIQIGQLLQLPPSR